MHPGYHNHFLQGGTTNHIGPFLCTVSLVYLSPKYLLQVLFHMVTQQRATFHSMMNFSPTTHFLELKYYQKQSLETTISHSGLER